MLIQSNKKLLHRNYAIDFLKEQAFIAYVGFLACCSSIGTLLYYDAGAQTLVWTISFALLETASFLLRYFNDKIFKTLEKRELFGRVMNLVDGIAFCGCLLFVSSISVTSAIFISSIMLLMCAGAAMTSAGYRPLLWSFCVPVFITQIITFSFYFVISGIHFYGVFVFIAVFSVYLVHGSASKVRHGLYSVIGARLEAERANQSKTRFFAASTHDLRQPLAALGALLAVTAQKNKDDTLNDLLDKSSEAAKMVDKQISPMMELARIDSGNLTVNKRPFDLVNCLKSLISICEKRLGPSVSLNEQLLDKAEYYSDPDLVERIINNIIDNSIKYTREGYINVSLQDERKFYKLVIYDTGLGIPKNKLDMIFDEFYQIDNPDRDPSKGFGLGLPIVSRISKKLGISLLIDSKYGVHTRVTLLFPKS